MATTYPSGGTVVPPRLSIPAHVSGDRVKAAISVSALEDDVVLVKLEGDGLSIELPLSPDAALDLSIRLCGSVIRLRRRSE